MRIILISIICMMLLSSCAYHANTYYVQNNTNDSINLEFFRVGLVDLEGTVPPNSNINLLRTIGVDSSVMIPFIVYDSIRVSMGHRFIMYYRDSISKNKIYHFENWIKERKGRNAYNFTYIFHAEDFK